MNVPQSSSKDLVLTADSFSADVNSVALDEFVRPEILTQSWFSVFSIPFIVSF